MNVIYLDVDGVLNPHKGKNPGKHWNDYKKYDVNYSLRIWLSKQLGEALMTLPAEIVWATTWEHYANIKIAPIIGFPKLRVLPFNPPYIDSLKNSGKRNSVSFDAKNKNAVVWIDDDLGLDDKAWIKYRNEDLGLPTLGVKPHPGVGLRKKDILNIREFLNDNLP